MSTSFNPDDFDFIPLSNEEGKALDLSDSLKACLVKSSVLEQASSQAFSTLSFTFVQSHLEHVIKAALSPDASDNDRYVCACILKNALVASQGVFPLCQDTGIANIFGWKKGAFITEGNEYEALSEGARKVYDQRKLRFSTAEPTSFWNEIDPKNNMPAQISIWQDKASLAPLPAFVEKAPEESLSLLCCAKGGGSSNKTSFIQGTKASLTPQAFTKFLQEQISKFGTSACPPYTIAVVAGGLSPEQNLLTLKLATAGAYDKMTYTPNPQGFRDAELEKQVMDIASKTGYGAQFGGNKFALEAIVIRLPRHGASCPLSAGVSCSAHRNLKVHITEKGIYLEKTCKNPALLEGFDEAVRFADSSSENQDQSLNINTEMGMEKVLETLKDAKPGQRLLLSGKILVARDAAHARWQKLLDSGKDLPDYCSRYPICYAGPARTPEGKVIGSFGPTTAGRMDVYAESLMSRKASLVTLAKGNRSRQWTDACKKYGAFYLGTPGGIAALIASNYISSQEIIDYEDLGMEAVRLVTVENLPAFVITNGKGEDFYENLKK